ncbi:MAG: type IV secretory system conjugative DNA transfer family protein [Pseudomonadota bacterium]
MKNLHNEYHLSFLPPGIGTLRARKLQGDSRFLSLLELSTEFKYEKGGLLLGRPLKPHRLFGLADGVRVGPRDDRHHLTIAGSRSGKGVAALIPNLIEYPGSAVVTDPKGELARITAARRGHGGGRVAKGLGQDVHIFDPEGMMEGRGHVTSSWNPLAELALNDLGVLDDAKRIATAIIPDPPGGDGNQKFFIGKARGYLVALILHTLEVEDRKDQNLIFIRKLILEGDRELFDYCEKEARKAGKPNPYANPRECLLAFMAQASNYAGNQGNFVSGIALDIVSMAEETKSGVLSQVEQSTAFLDGHYVAKALSSANFKLDDLKNKPTTIYLCIRGTSLSGDLKSVLSLFVEMAIVAAERNASRVEHPILFAMDEFYALGHMEVMDKAIGLVAGFGVKLWPVLQELSQLQQLYPKTWKNFLGNCGSIQMFGGFNNQDTIDYAKQRLGDKVFITPDGQSVRQALLTDNELLTSYFSRDAGRQLVFFANKPVAALELMPHFLYIPKHLYNDEDPSPAN